MISLTEIFEKQYASEIGTLYQVLSNNLISANNEEEKEEAKKRFKSGLKIAVETFNTAVELSES